MFFYMKNLYKNNLFCFNNISIIKRTFSKIYRYKFVDSLRITTSGGKGGNGCNSFEKLASGRKIPDGGHGGQGGNVYIVADPNTNSIKLSEQSINAGKGGDGGSQKKMGKRGDDKIINVPIGTVVYELIKNLDYNNNEEFEEIFCIDLDKKNMKYLAATGGKPGLGNCILKGSRKNQAINAGKSPGSPGNIKYYKLILKTIADAGLVGFPNAGKSTFLSQVSNAKPKIASYPFTTLHPNIGKVIFSNNSSFTIADIPGIIEGAAKDNRGLGLEFLKHIERTKILIYIIDISLENNRDLNNIINEYNILRNEIKYYNEELLNRPSILLANKIDYYIDDENFNENIFKEKSNELINILNIHIDIPIYPISGNYGYGIKDVIIELKNLINVN